MQKSILILMLLSSLISCKSSKRIVKNSENTKLTSIKKNDVSSASLANKIINNAMAYTGVRYKYGGTTKSGMDCSGLVYTAFKKEHIELPRVSKDMAKSGVKIALDSVKVGDLLFFQTNKKRKVINHVGLVITSRTGQIEFIHSTTGQGVIVSSLAEHYWYYSFIEARRVL